MSNRMCESMQRLYETTEERATGRRLPKQKTYEQAGLVSAINFKLLRHPLRRLLVRFDGITPVAPRTPTNFVLGRDTKSEQPKKRKKQIFKVYEPMTR